MKRIISLLMAAILFFSIGAETFAAYEGDKACTYESADCTITYSIANEWSGNQQVSVSITNNSDETLRNWAIKLDGIGTVTNIWNATVLKNDGELCVIRNNGYNYEIIPGATVEFGFMQQGEDLRLPENISICSRTADSTESAEISYEIQNNWDEGFIAAVTIKNVSDEPLEAWKLHFNGNFEIVTLWNGNLLHTDDSSFKVENDITTTPIDIGGTKSFSFEGRKSADEEPVMSDFVLTSIVIDVDEEETEEPDETAETADSTTSETADPSTGESTETSELNTAETTDTKETETVETTDVPTTETGETSETDETTETTEPTETEEPIILCFGEYLAEENAVEVYWYSNAEGAVSVYESADNGGWMKLAEVVDEDSYKIAITEDFLVKQIKVKQETGSGTIESEPFIVAYTEGGYVCTWLDTDEDGLPDYAEKIYGTDPENHDTDSDGLSDYDEIYTVGTSPLKYDTDEDGTNDADSDLDKDGLTNAQELELGTSPSSEDTDGDTLSDYAELYETNTDPLKADTDGDTLSDSDDIVLGLDPNDPENFGVPDAEYKVEQTISADSEVMERVNTDEAPYELSLEITASGNAATNLIAGSSVYSTITESSARLGGAVSLSYYGGEVENVKLIYEVGEDYISNDGSEYAANCVDLQGIKRYNIFRYFEDVNMLLPVATEFDVDNNTLYAETDELGTYCVLDMEVLLQNFGVAPDGTQMETVMAEYYSATEVSEASVLNVSDETTEATDSFDASDSAEKYYVTFVLDARKDALGIDDFKIIKNEIADFAETAFSEFDNLSIRLLAQGAFDFCEDQTQYTIDEINKSTYTNIADFNSALDDMTLETEDCAFGNYYEFSDAMGEVIKISDSSAYNYIFNIYAQENAIYEQIVATELVNNAMENRVNVSIISDVDIYNGLQIELSYKTGGIQFNNYSDIAEEVYDHIIERYYDTPNEPKIFLTSVLDTITLADNLNQWNDVDSDYVECSQTDDRYINDHLSDWKEVGVEYWVKEGLMSVDPDTGDAILPTYKECMAYIGVPYLEIGMDRFKTGDGVDFGLAILNQNILPYLSNPVVADSDCDGITDGYDPHKLLAIDIDTPCLYDPNICGANNHRLMIMQFGGEIYHCVNCEYEVVAPELEDRAKLDDEDFVLVKTLLSLIYNLCQNQQIQSAEMLYAVVDKIRYYNAKEPYSISDENGRYCSPMLYTAIDEENDYWISIDLYNSTNLYRIEQLLKDVAFYTTKTAIDIAMLNPEISLPFGIAWVFLSEYLICCHESDTWGDSNEQSVKLGAFYACYDDKYINPEYPEYSNILSAANTFLTAWNLIGVFGQKINTYWSSPELYYGINVTIMLPEFEHCYSVVLDGIIANDSLAINYNSFTEYLFDNDGEMPYKNTITLVEDIAFGTKYNYTWAIVGDTYYWREMGDILDGNLSWNGTKEIDRGKYN